MNDRILFGASYYEEYLPYDRLERDLTLMEEAGMNVIRIGESTWSVEEPKPGAYDFSHVTRVIEHAARHGIDVIVGTPTCAVPVWLSKADDGVLGGNAYGPRQNMDITDPTYLRHAEGIIRALVKATASYPNVIGFQIDNGTRHYGAHGERVLSGFREWLRLRFGNIEALNHAFGLNHWSNSVASFDELPDPAGAVNGSYICAFEEYRRRVAASFLRWQAGIVSEHKRSGQFITHNFDYEWRRLGEDWQQEGMSAGVQPDMNPYDAARAVSVAGTNIYCPAAGALTGREIAFGGDLMRPLKRAPYLVLESQAQALTGWLPYPGQLRLMALSHIASGACGVMYWPWLSIHNGIESYWKGVLSHDGMPDAVYDEIKHIGRTLHRLSPELTGLKKDVKIAMVVSAEALHAMRIFPTDKGLSYNDCINAWYAALYELNLECDVIYDKEMNWSGYDLLLFPQLYCASEALIARVREFVSGGGAVLASFRSFFADENLKIYPDRQPHGLTDVFGMHYSRFTREPDSHWMELLEPNRAASAGRYEHPCWGRYAAATRNRFGKGHAWYLGTWLEGEELREFVLRVCEAAGITAPLLRWPIVCRRAVSPAGDQLTFLFNYSAQEHTIKCPSAGTELLSKAYYDAGANLTLPEWGAAILKH